MYRIFALFFLVLSSWCFSQSVAAKLDASVKSLLSTSAAYSSNLSVYVSDENGNFVYEHDGNKGLSTASTQKIFTSACALETLGKEYQYTTTISYSGTLNNGVVDGNLILFSTGDPTLGSWRYDGFKPENFKLKFINALKEKGIKEVTGNFIIDDSYFDFQTIPGGWPWDDLGNYYGAGVWGVNWRENQFDLKVKGSIIQNANVELPGVRWVSDLSAGGNSDQSLIFTAPHSDVALINGTLPAGKVTTVAGATPNPPLTLASEMLNWLQEAGIQLKGNFTSASQERIQGSSLSSTKQNLILEYKSPTLEKIVYWFMRKSVNLYGETFVKTIAKEKKGIGSFPVGIDYLKAFWKGKGINPSMINFADGSGLSPQNYVSARAEVQALLYAKKQSWYNAFFSGFPTQGNGMKMKSGTMRNTKSFAGYHNGYVFSIIINNYQGGNSSEALYKVLNNLK